LRPVEGVLEGTGYARVGVVEGFRDILENGYERRYDQYDIKLGQPVRIVPRDRCSACASVSAPSAR
jgi:hypothetical protein